MSLTDNHITAVVLAGGMARRMNGQDKGLIQFAGLSMAERIVNQLLPQCDHIVINANRHHDEYGKLGLEVFSDEMADYQGPLAGMHAALKRYDSSWIITVPCDGPFLADNYISMMRNAAERDSTKLAVASFENRLQPVYALIHKSLEQDLGVFLQSGERKIDRWYHQHTFSVVDFDQSPEMFANINTPEELDRLEKDYYGNQGQR